MSNQWSINNQNKQRVCVLGAGAAGLCAARHLSETNFTFDVYEKTSKVGGLWNYTDSVGNDDYGLPIHTSLYKYMRTNLPMAIMEFQDFPSKCEESFVSHKTVLQYLEEYTKHFDLMKYIKILKISRFETIWKLLIKDIKTNEIKEEFYDFIFVCNGRYSVPKIPTNLKGIENFKGKILHSHNYRTPQQFKGENVLVLGAGPSGVDISIELSEEANQVVVCHQNSNVLSLPKNIIQEMSEIKEFNDKEIEFKSGNRRQFDSIILCTGYLLDFSFLDKSCAISVNQWGRADGVYMQLINQTYPSMAIFGIPYKVVPFPLYNLQVLFYIKCMTKELILPSKQQMEEITDEDIRKKSIHFSEKHYHKMVPNMFDYCDQLSQMAQIETISTAFRRLYLEVESQRNKDLTKYKRINYKIISNENYIKN